VIPLLDHKRVAEDEKPHNRGDSSVELSAYVAGGLKPLRETAFYLHWIANLKFFLEKHLD
jgi:hypothetical protein